MCVKIGCWLVLLAFVCGVALTREEVSKDYVKEIESDINTFFDNGLFQPKMCNYTNPCQNGGTCSQNVCSCLNGTSGHLCETIDDCSSRCGWEKCLYNVTSREIYCKCDIGYAFHDKYNICKACDCGLYRNDPNALKCSFVEGRKKCTCREPYADRLGRCTSCSCYGFYSSGCHYDDSGRKNCNCIKGYAQIDDTCKRCDCGIHGNCSLSYEIWRDIKSCKCEKGYADNYGTCKECDCGENGTCSFRYGEKICDCNVGFVEYEGTCKECNCGDFSRCELDRYGNKECTCDESYALNSGVCRPCWCDPGTTCIFKNELEKECICPHGYANFHGTCTECDCQMDDSNCTMDSGLKKCQCPKGFESTTKPFALNPTCTDIDECLQPQDNDCPFSTKCVNKWGSYDCVCREGFEVKIKFGDYDIKKLGCKDIDECLDYSACFDMHARCVNTPGSYRCECKAGYTVGKDYKEKYNFCNEDSRPWRTASIVVGCLFGFVILGLLIGICNKHCDM